MVNYKALIFFGMIQVFVATSLLAYEERTDIDKSNLYSSVYVDNHTLELSRKAGTINANLAKAINVAISDFLLIDKRISLEDYMVNIKEKDSTYRVVFFIPRTKKGTKAVAGAFEYFLDKETLSILSKKGYK